MKIQMIKKLGIVSCLTVACAVVLPTFIAPTEVSAQCNAGFILFGDNAKNNALDYCLDSCKPNQIDRYYLEIKPQKFKITEVILTYTQYPDNFDGRFGAFDKDNFKDNYKLRVTGDCRGGKELEIESATWDKENRRITIIPKEPIPSKTALRVVLSDVRNANFGGFYQLDGRVMRGDIPKPEYIGSWFITLE